MPSAEADEMPRVVIDEASFDFTGLDGAGLEDHLFRFNEAVWDLRDYGITAWKPPMFEATECSVGYELPEYLMSGPGKNIDRDIRLKFFSIVDKCPEWHAAIPGSCAEVSLAGEAPVMALSISCALALAIHNHGTSCLVFGACERRGFVNASSQIGGAEIFFFSDALDLPKFWRHIFELENVQESEFFTLADQAFPQLVLHETLNFRKFDGTYPHLRNLVTRHLAVLNDHFLSAFESANGDPSQVEALLTPYGLAGISPESRNTHRDSKVMNKHNAEYGGKTYLCEWHTKLEPHRNRIYFAFKDFIPGKILVGFFTIHL